LPHPEILQKFDLVVPGAAERIIAMAEKQSAHRMELESKVITADIESSRKGQLFGFVVALGGLLSSFVLVINGFQVVGGILGGATLVSLVSVFVYGSKTRKDERVQKAEKVDELASGKEN
jgi:uncharacterized membrane protein